MVEQPGVEREPLALPVVAVRWIGARHPQSTGILVHAASDDLQHQRLAVGPHAEQAAGHGVDAQLGVDRLYVVRGHCMPERPLHRGIVDVHVAPTRDSTATSLRSQTTSASDENAEHAMTTASIDA